MSKEGFEKGCSDGIGDVSSLGVEFGNWWEDSYRGGIEDDLALCVNLGIDEGAYDRRQEGSPFVPSLASPKVLNTASKIAAETASKMACCLVSRTASTKELKTALGMTAEKATKWLVAWCQARHRRRV